MKILSCYYSITEQLKEIHFACIFAVLVKSETKFVCRHSSPMLFEMEGHRSVLKTWIKLTGFQFRLEIQKEQNIMPLFLLHVFVYLQSLSRPDFWSRKLK